MLDATLARPPRDTVTAGPRLRRRQRLHAGLMTMVPAAATLAALAHAAVHGVSAAPLVAFAVMYAATFTGITVGFHRLASHAAFSAGPVVRAILLGLGSMAAQGPVSYWATNHRRHHAHSDRDGDPHSPHLDGPRPLTGLRGFWHAHLGWSFDHALTNTLVYGKDLARDPVVALINRHYYWLVAAGLALPALACGLVAGSARGAAAGLVWGGLVRLFATYHAAACINSVTHLTGRRPYTTRDHSSNVAWLALPTLGESWHNNHHAFPGSAIFGHRWWQLDLGAGVIRALETVSLVADVHRPRQEAHRDD
jgi:stearoyl-CoA desaturase (delta-9 desaturase)